MTRALCLRRLLLRCQLAFLCYERPWSRSTSTSCDAVRICAVLSIAPIKLANMYCEQRLSEWHESVPGKHHATASHGRVCMGRTTFWPRQHQSLDASRSQDLCCDSSCYRSGGIPLSPSNRCSQGIKFGPDIKREYNTTALRLFPVKASTASWTPCSSR